VNISHHHQLVNLEIMVCNTLTVKAGMSLGKPDMALVRLRCYS
jgi:hypothetical protein